MTIQEAISIINNNKSQWGIWTSPTFFHEAIETLLEMAENINKTKEIDD